MAKLRGHRQTKETATDKPNLLPPRHIPTLLRLQAFKVCFRQPSCRWGLRGAGKGRAVAYPTLARLLATMVGIVTNPRGDASFSGRKVQEFMARIAGKALVKPE
jgi:hypothetical protein